MTVHILTNDYVPENLNEQIRQLGDVVRAHDAVHPDHDVCGGVGGCRLLHSEVEAGQEVMDYMRRLLARGYTVHVDVRGID